jgi:biotin carboxyl carrier protein
VSSTIRFPGDFGDGDETTRLHDVARLNVCAVAGALRGQVFAPDGGALVLGRANNCSIVIESDGVSRAHARIGYRSGQYWVEPQDTLNGTRVNEQLIHAPQALGDGDRISICDHSFLVYYGEPDAQAVQYAMENPQVAQAAGPAPRHQPHAPTQPHAQPQPPPQLVQRMDSNALVAQALGPAPRTPAAMWVLGIVGLLGLVAGTVVATVWLMGDEGLGRSPPTATATPTATSTPTSTSTEPSTATATATATGSGTTLAVVEAVDIVDVVAGSTGRVSELVARGRRVERGDVVAKHREGSEESSMARRKLRELERKYGKSPEHADFIAAARDEYAKARAKRRVRGLASTVEGVVVEVVAREGGRVRSGEVVLRVAGAARLIVDAAAVHGTRCTASLANRDVRLVGLVESVGSDETKRALRLEQFPGGMKAGEILTVRMTCEP